MPVRMSPEPPFARPGLPVVLTAMEPSGWAMRVRQPLRTRVRLMLGGEAAGEGDAVGFDLGDGEAGEAGELAGMRGEDRGCGFSRPSVPLAASAGGRGWGRRR